MIYQVIVPGREINTGRLYGPEGQRIRFLVINVDKGLHNYIIFNDLDRNICGSISVVYGIDDKWTIEKLMRMNYDYNNYAYFNDSVFAKLYDLEANQSFKSQI